MAMYRAWTRALVVQGYVVLAVDSATSRGFGQTCSASPDRNTMWRDRPKDAYAALQYLQAQPFVQGRPGRPDGLVARRRRGAADHQRQEHRPARQGWRTGFKAAVSFYPGACSERSQSKPYTEVEPQGWTTQVPLLLLMGEADTWTPFKPCEAFITAANARGNPIELKSYPLRGARLRCAEYHPPRTARNTAKRRPHPGDRDRPRSPRRRLPARAGIFEAASGIELMRGYPCRCRSC